MTHRPLLLLLALAAAACGGGRSDADAAPGDDDGMVPGRPADSLALRMPSGVEVWFTGSRPAMDAAGKVCVEHSMQIRDGERHVNIPLLYTGQAPTMVNDSTIEAAIWLDCQPGNVYQVNLRTGQPVRVR